MEGLLLLTFNSRFHPYYYLLSKRKWSALLKSKVKYKTHFLKCLKRYKLDKILFTAKAVHINNNF